MISQIGYLVQVSSRTSFFAAWLYAVGVTFGAGLLGLVIGTAGALIHWLLGIPFDALSPYVLIPVATLGLIGSLNDIGIYRLPVIGSIRQLPRHYMQVFGPLKTLFIWGFYVGISYRTRFGYAFYYVMASWVFLAGKPLFGMIVMMVYGLTQGLLLVIDIMAIIRGAEPAEGLLGQRRTTLFFYAGGTVLLACSIFLFTQLNPLP